MSANALNAPRRRGMDHVRRPLAALIAAALPFAAVAVAPNAAEAKTPGHKYCFYKTCHRVKTLAETAALVGSDMTLVASHYDDCRRDRYNPCGLTSSGERFRPNVADNAASPILPDGTIALVWSAASKEAIVIRINNAGPYWGDRKLDLSRAAAKRLGIGGVGKVKLRILKAPTAEEARYQKNRTYEPVPGPIGRFASLDEAHVGTNVLVALGAPGASSLESTVRLAALPNAFDRGATPVAARSPLIPRFSPAGSDLTGGFKAALEAQSATEARLAGLAAARAGVSLLTRVGSLDETSGITLDGTTSRAASEPALAVAKVEVEDRADAAPAVALEENVKPKKKKKVRAARAKTKAKRARSAGSKAKRRPSRVETTVAAKPQYFARPVAGLKRKPAGWASAPAPRVGSRTVEKRRSRSATNRQTGWRMSRLEGQISPAAPLLPMPANRPLLRLPEDGQRRPDAPSTRPGAIAFSALA